MKLIYNCSLKNIVVMLLCMAVQIIPTTSHAQEEVDATLEDYYNIFDEVVPSSGYLLNLGFPEIEDLNFCDLDGMTGGDCSVLTGNFEWRGWYEKLRVSAKPSTLLPDLDDLSILSAVPNTVVPIGVIYLDGNYIPIDTLDRYVDTLNIDSLNIYIPPNIPSDIVNVFSIANLKNVVYQSSVAFELNTDLIFSNIEVPPLGFEIDFGDGLGFQNMPFGTFSHTANYPNRGGKSIVFKLHTENGILTSFSKLYVSSRDCLLPNQEGVVSANLPDNTVVSGEYSIVYGCDGVFDRPVILVEGFDPFLNRTTTDICTGYRQFWDHAKERGLDLVSIKFSNNHGLIQNNAQALKALIRLINTTKEGNFESIVIAESMGGLISRIALAEMEQDGEDHQVRLYTSFDSPHKGANTPLSLQEIAEDFFDINLVEFIGPMLDVLNIISIGPSPPLDARWSEIPDLIAAMYNSPAARQMLIRHRDYMYSFSPEFLTFQEFMENLGFPENLRKVALINGGKNGNRQQTEDGLLEENEYYFKLNKGVLGGFFKGEAWAKVSPVNEDTVHISKIKIKVAWVFRTTNKNGHASFFSKAYDIAPGGTQGFENIIFSFVPVFSSIALDEAILDDPESLFLLNEASGEYLQSIRGFVENGWTPFDNIYADTMNTGHVSLSAIDQLFNQYCRQEIMMDSFFIQNRGFLNNEAKDFHAYDLMRLGREVDPWQEEKIISSGDVELKDGSVVNVSSDYAVNLRPGFSAQAGTQFHAFINAPPTCDPEDKASGALPAEYAHLIISDPVIQIDQDKNTGEVMFSVSNLFTNPEKAQINWTVMGNGIHQKLSVGQNQKIIDLPPGQYAVSCSLYGGARSLSKLFLVRGDRTMNEASIKEESEITTPTPNTFYPNPAQNTLQWTDGQTYQISLYDTNGRLVKELKQVTSIDMTGLPSGAYAIVLRSLETGLVTKEIIIKE